VEAALMKNHIVSGSGIDCLIADCIRISFSPYHFPVPFCSLPFCPITRQTFRRGNKQSSDKQMENNWCQRKPSARWH